MAKPKYISQRGTSPGRPATADAPATRSPKLAMQAGPPVANDSKWRGRVTAGISETPGCEITHRLHAAAAWKTEARRPPASAMCTPATRMPRNKRRLATVAVKTARGIAAPSWKKASARTAGACAANQASEGPRGAKGEGKAPPMAAEMTRPTMTNAA